MTAILSKLLIGFGEEALGDGVEAFAERVRCRRLLIRCGFAPAGSGRRFALIRGESCMTLQKWSSRAAAPVVLLIAILVSNVSSVQSSTWNKSTGGSWATPANWDSIPNATDAIANFDTLDLSADAAVTLDGNFTVGSLIFGDIVPAPFPGPASNWIVNAGTPANNTLTLNVSSGTPTINVVNPTAQPINSAGPPAADAFYKLFVDQTATINTVLAGSKGMNKTGYGTLVLTRPNTYTGTTSVQNGTLTLDFSATGAPASNILASGSALSLGGGFNVAGNGVLNINGASGATNSQTVSGTTIDFGNNAINANQNGANAVNLSLGTVTRINHGVVNFTLPTTGTVSANVSNANGIIGGWATVGTGANASWAVNDGSGHIVAKTTGFTDVTGAPTILSDPTSNVRWSNSTGNATLNAGTTDLNSLIFTDVYTGAVDLRTVNIPAGSTLRMGAQGGIFRTDNIGNQAQLLLTIGAATSYVTAGGAPNTPGELNFNANNAPINADQNGIVVASAITDNGTGPVSVVASGVSTTQANVLNTYSGGTYINSGRFRAQVAGAMGTGSVYTAPGAQAYFNVGNGVFYNNVFLSGMGYWETGGFTSGNTRLASNGEVLCGTITLLNDSMISTRGATAAGAQITGQITGAFSPYFSGGQLSGGTPGTMLLTNSANNYSGDTVLTNGRVSIGGIGEVIPDGPGKGNLVMVGEGYLTAGQGTNTYLNLNGNTETINGLISSQGFEGNPSDPTRDFIENSLSNSTGTLNIGGNNASSNFAGTIRDFNPVAAGLAVPTNAKVAIGKIGTGTLTLSGSNTYSGGTNIAAGKLVLGNASAIGTGNVTLSAGATLDLNGNGGSGTPVTVASLNGAGGTITSGIAGSGPLTLVVGDVNNANSSYGGVIQNGAATVALQKEGSGQLVLSGANTFTGGTTINNGGLVVTGSLASSGTVTLANSGNPTVLAATGNVGNVVLAAGANATVRPGSGATGHSVGTLTASGLTVNSGNLQFDLAGSGTSDAIAVNGTANFASGGNSTIGVTFTNGVPVAGTYTLLTANTLTLGHTPTLDSTTAGLFASSRFTSATINTATANTIKFVLAGSNANLTWTGGGDGSSWDLNATQNWSNNGGTSTNSKFLTFDNVTFDDSASAASNHTVNLSAQLTPGSVTVNHSTGNDYVIQGGGGIAGDTVSLTKTGTGVLTLATNNNTYGGGTFVKNGTLKVGSATALPAGSAVTLGDGSSNTSGVLDLSGQSATVGNLATAGTGTNNVIGTSSGLATLNYAGGSSTFAGKIQDNVPNGPTGTMVALNVASGTLTLSGSDSFTGGTTINAGATLKAGSSAALAPAGGLALALGGTLDLNGNSVTVGLLSGDPSLANTGGKILSSASGAAGITIGDPSNDSTFAGQIQDGAGTVSVTKANSTTLTLSGVNSYSGTTNINAGTLKVSNFYALGSATGGAVNIASGATLDLGGVTTANLAGGNFALKQFKVAGTGVGGNGAIVDTGAVAQQNAFGRIQLTADASFGGSQRFDIHAPLNGTANGGQLDLNGKTLTKIGNNVFGIVNADVTAGDIVVGVGGQSPVPGGTLSIEGTTNILAVTNPTTNQPSMITVNDGSILQFSGNTGTVTRPIVLNGNATLSISGNTTAIVGSNVTMNGTTTFTSTSANGNGILTLNGSIGESGGSRALTLTANGTGVNTLILGGNNTYTGDTVVNGGILQLGASNRIAVVSRLTLGGGTFNSGGFNETMGALNLMSPSTIDFGNGASTLHFADSSALPWSGPLTINDWTGGSDHLFFAASASGLTSTQLSQVSFAGHAAGAKMLSTGEVVPLPSILLGDFNQDGHVDATDLQAEMQALTNVNAYQSGLGLSNSDLLQIADVNADQKFNNADLQGLIAYLQSGHGSMAAVPEPGTFGLAALGAGLLCIGKWRRRG
jgi:fibronectin-binding autotransporter adhesin